MILFQQLLTINEENIENIEASDLVTPCFTNVCIQYSSTEHIYVTRHSDITNNNYVSNNPTYTSKTNRCKSNKGEVAEKRSVDVVCPFRMFIVVMYV